ncbi:hypothetical protein GC197_07935 [bacterium]|nr:hypothetical protein [bacterium]
MVKGPGYTVADLIFYAGLIAGLVVTFMVLKTVFDGIPHLVNLIISGTVGLGVGWIFSSLYERSSSTDKFD